MSAAKTLTDELPDASNPPTGCRYHPRCPAIISPEEIDLAREEWIGVTALRLNVEDGWSDAEEFLDSLGGIGADTDDAIRAEFDLPSTLSDPAAESALREAVAALERNDLSAAVDRLRTVGTSVCERDVPSLIDEHTPHGIACHRYVPDQPGEPLDGRRERRQ